MAVLDLTTQEISNLTAEDVAHLAVRLEQDDYGDPFEALRDWHLLRAIAFQRQELVQPYRYLLDIETFDEA
ncbi:MAG: DUF2555 domain-containing protein [Chloroflexaceae bacterium]|nr:DUF2555 domain-containing protein [Chloroflexaceae bacterium]